MTLQGSGAISISQIRAELGSSSYSLRTLSAAAGKGAPDAMSEFYGYSAVSPGKFWYLYNSSDPGPYPEFWGYTNVYSNYVSAGPAFPGESLMVCVKQGTVPDTGSQGDIPYTFNEPC